MLDLAFDWHSSIWTEESFFFLYRFKHSLWFPATSHTDLRDMYYLDFDVKQKVQSTRDNNAMQISGMSQYTTSNISPTKVEQLWSYTRCIVRFDSLCNYISKFKKRINAICNAGVDLVKLFNLKDVKNFEIAQGVACLAPFLSILCFIAHANIKLTICIRPYWDIPCFPSSPPRITLLGSAWRKVFLFLHWVWSGSIYNGSRSALFRQ